MKITFTTDAWQDYLYWQKMDKKILRRINRLIQDTCRHPYKGIGKPELLRHQLESCWSRRIDQEHRLVYIVKDHQIEILQCRYHY